MVPPQARGIYFSITGGGGEIINNYGDLGKKLKNDGRKKKGKGKKEEKREGKKKGEKRKKTSVDGGREGFFETSEFFEGGREGHFWFSNNSKLFEGGGRVHN